MNFTKKDLLEANVNKDLMTCFNFLGMYLFLNKGITLPTDINTIIKKISKSIEDLENANFTVCEIIKILTGVFYNDQHTLLFDFALEDKAVNLTVSSGTVLSCLCLFEKRFNTVTNYAISKKKEQKWQVVNSSGSDPHLNGRHTLFVEIPVVYKERSLNVDNAFVGKDGFISYCNTLINDPKYKLPTMCINSDSMLEEFVIKKEQFTQSEAKVYYFQLGELECIAEVIGATDLHHDNIMPTSQGPLVIDAECAFFHTNAGTLIRSHALGNSSVRMGKEPALASFIIDGMDSVEEYKKNKEYQSAFDQGYKYLANILSNTFKSNRINMSGIITQIISKIDRIRILPWATPDLAISLKSFYERKYIDPKNEAKFRTEIVKIFMDDLKKYLDSTGYKYKLENIDLGQILKSAFTSGTLPSFELFLQKQNIALLYLDGVRIGSIDINHSMIISKTIYKIEQKR